MGATLIGVPDSNSDDLAEVGGRLYLSDLNEETSKELRHADSLGLDRAADPVLAANATGEPIRQAVVSANASLKSERDGLPSVEEG